MPPKAAGHTMTEFAAQCSDRMSMSPDEGNFLNYDTDIKKNLMRGQPINPPKIIASHALNDVAIKKLVQQLPTVRVTKILILQRVICLIKITILMEERATLMGYK